MHYEKLCKWLSHFKLGIPDPELLSDCGVVCNGVAIGFLYLTNSRQASIDRVATDPKSTARDRDEAVVELIDALVQIAHWRGSKVVTILANIPTMISRLEKMGFNKYADYSIYYKEMK